MPAFVITAFLAIRKKALGLTGLPALFILGAGILSPLALAEVLKPVRFNMQVNPGDFWLFSILSMIFLALSAVWLTALKNPER
jgi:ABC-type antimicrobial peptide transport system permease subunit